jgi:carbon storage regulator
MVLPVALVPCFAPFVPWRRLLSMLVLSRKIGEKIVIGHDVVVTVLEVRGDTIKVGVLAPRHISVHRAEVYQDIVTMNKQAATQNSALPVVGISGLSKKVMSFPVIGKAVPSSLPSTKSLTVTLEEVEGKKL